ncbi:MAG TPA: DUF4175 domain-containing protein [Polyangiaceae bacterium]
MNGPLPEALAPLAEIWHAAVSTPRRRATVAGAALVVAVALLIARGGTLRTRVGAATGMVVAAGVVLVAARRERGVWGDPRRAIDRVAGTVAPDQAARAQRALGLLYGAAADPGFATSPELAALHVRRTLAALPKDAIEASANKVGLRFAGAALGLAVGVLVVALVAPWAVLEGLDVILARHGVAPVPMTWLDEPLLQARPPDYLHETEHSEPAFGETALPRGTLLTYRGAPIHPGRALELTDGVSSVPFVEDGQGQVVARWPLAASVTLRVVARFGEVLVREGDATAIRSIADEKPRVLLEGAPKRIELAHPGEELGGGWMGEAGEIPIRYEATDDHGLREVHFVLRAGTREERRVLARLDGETRSDKGGHVLRANDPFVKKSHVPVEVTVEAKDNDPITGPKWGASEAITIVPPDVGEPQALRLDALRKLRDRFVDSLAWRMEHDVPKPDAARKTMLADEGKTVDDDGELLDATVSGSYAGVRVPGRLQARLRGQLRKVREAMTKEARVASPQTHAALVKASERIALVCDAMVRGLGERDVHGAAKQLADVADDVVAGEGMEARADERERGKVRSDAAVGVLEGGAKAMLRLGDLGRDIGEIVQADDSRIGRARGESDWAHAELAARDLAARLREPDPSFGAQGGPQRGGGESGGGRGTPGEDDEEGDEVGQAFQEAAQDLEKLAQDHAGEMAKVENELSGAADSDDAKSMSEEGKKHAEKVRESVRPLPSIGAGSESWSGKAAAAREHAEQMARALEEGSPADAVSSGRSALQALEEAKRAAKSDPWRRFDDRESDAEKEVDAAKKRLEPEIAWAEEKLQEMRKKAAERARGQLGESGQEEGAMAERARQLGQKGRDQMPGSALDALEEAEKAMQHAADGLRAGDPDHAMEDQREAQRQLEMAKQAMGSQSDDNGESGDANGAEDNGQEMSRDPRTQIPNADAHKGPEDFRRRVTEGLSQPASGRMKDAVRRYAEGLLR